MQKNQIFNQKQVFFRNYYNLQLQALKFLIGVDFRFQDKLESLSFCRKIKPYTKACTSVAFFEATTAPYSELIRKNIEKSCKTFAKTIRKIKLNCKAQAIRCIKLFSSVESITLIKSNISSKLNVNFALMMIRYCSHLSTLISDNLIDEIQIN